MWGVGAGFLYGALPLEQAVITERIKTITAKHDVMSTRMPSVSPVSFKRRVISWSSGLGAGSPLG